MKLIYYIRVNNVYCRRAKTTALFKPYDCAFTLIARHINTCWFIQAASSEFYFTYSGLNNRGLSSICTSLGTRKTKMDDSHEVI